VTHRAWILIIAIVATNAAAQDALTPAHLDSLAAAAVDTAALADSDSIPAALDLPAVRDFFDTGVNGTSAVLMTPVFPGWGQLYSGGGWRAMLAFGAQWWYWSHMLKADRDGVRMRDYAETLPYYDNAGAVNSTRTLWDGEADEYFEIYRDYAWYSGAILLLVTVDAYVGAGLYNFDEEPIPVPNRFDQYFDDNPEPIGSRGLPTLVVAQWGWRF